MNAQGVRIVLWFCVHLAAVLSDGGHFAHIEHLAQLLKLILLFRRWLMNVWSDLTLLMQFEKPLKRLEFRTVLDQSAHIDLSANEVSDLSPAITKRCCH